MSLFTPMTVDECEEFIAQHTTSNGGVTLDGEFSRLEIAAILCLLENNEQLRGDE